MTIVVTGAAGFIGFHLANTLLAQGERVVGIDSLNEYYDPCIKQARLARLQAAGLVFHRADVADPAAIEAVFATEPDTRCVVHLAAQAGVRYSLINPYAYVHSNVMGHVVMLEAARRLTHLRHFVYASSSSVYGLNRDLPFREADRVTTPTSLYAATKLADELISHCYAHLFTLPQTGLRFFTVYGPWGRPDMSYYLFAKAIMDGSPIELYGDGTLKRDFTYIDDIVAGILGVIDHPPAQGARVLNIGNHRSEAVRHLVALLEDALGKKAVIRAVPRPPTDVEETWASVDALHALTGFAPTTSLEVGIPKFVAWLKDFEKDQATRSTRSA